MGRLFVVELEGPVYKCKQCQTDLGRPNEIIFRHGTHRRIHEFSRVFNMFLVPPTLPCTRDDILCVCCSTRIGSHFRSMVYYSTTTYHVLRNKLHGPEGSDDDV